ncbi:MAG TPA: glycosyltransferase family 4 protein [Acidimicrobiales bacterium]|nr:glycosyltransferase family 4 protein [Acidimicrobiales bacterium]
MRLLFVVQRYGARVAGGAELCCREYATRLASRGHHVEVLTSCAVSYVDWANEFPEGRHELDGVVVNRLPVACPRDHDLFGPLHARVLGGRPTPLYLQREWMRQQGPYVPELPRWLEREADTFDAVVFFTYLYYTTWAGLPVAAAQAPTVLHPTAHDEPPIHLPLFDYLFRHATGLGYLTEEEGEFVERRFRLRRPSAVLGIGMDLDATGAEERFRREHGLGDRPYVVFVGRVDPHKGAVELADMFRAYKARNPGPLALVVVGEPVWPLEPHPDIVVTGFVDESVKRDALDGAIALLQPSYFESFSMVVTEAWVQGKPVLGQRRNDVVFGQLRRSGGGIPYTGFAEFECALDMVLGDAALRERLGKNGRAYVERRYRWDDVLDRYERFLGHISRSGMPARAVDPAASSVS